ncbi:hypothetical protein NW801_06810 [Brevibacillus laterosporus]|uniref:Uncharacterized protein n=1 Tax=Brevibacillus halotolerans TaxID=1507437 RepID=A0ABT4HUP1_9BACL|nr:MULTISPECIES: hypothetical protein [Brevibacillus]MCR8984787.1 hypothetical protein [Brevibacillus laterosporus]MCZ0830513.1 hypothetical protein [Brevibacillus halotolerans]
MRKKQTNNVNIAILSTSLTLFSLLIINGGSDASAASLAVGGEVVAVKKTLAASLLRLDLLTRKKRKLSRINTLEKLAEV